MTRRGYAADTTVPEDLTRLEIERLVVRAGADGFWYAQEGREAQIGFKMRDRLLKFRVPFLGPEDVATTRSSTPQSIANKVAQARRARWRALLLIIKAKLEAVDAGIVIFEDEFLSATVVPGGDTVAEWVRPQIDEAYRTGALPAAVLPQLGPGR